MSLEKSKLIELDNKRQSLVEEQEMLIPLAWKLDKILTPYYNQVKVSVFDNGGAFASIDFSKTPIALIPEVMELIKSIEPCKFPKLSEQLREHTSPYLISCVNNVKNSEVRVKFHTKLNNGQTGQIWIKLPTEFYSDDVLGYGQRGVYETEHHYYGGTSRTEIGKIRLSTRGFDMYNVQRWYGGNIDCWIDDEDDQEPYEFMIFNGTVKEFSEQHHFNLLSK